jgi:ParB family transcriptional regulator, chromosome partitioning protein
MTAHTPHTPQIESLPIAGLIPYARNSRTHSGEQINQIAASIQEYGFTNPVLIDAQGGIIAGHGRVMAAQSLGLEDLPCIRLTHLSDAQKRAYIIADNKLALNAGWDDELLRIELAELGEIGFDLDLTGFDIAELDKILWANHTQELEAMPTLPTGDKAPFQQVTFTLHDSQADELQRALKQSRAMGPFIDMPNENGNGNALARICETFLTQHADR